MDEEEAIEDFLNNGINKYINIVKTQVYDKLHPYIIALLLSLTP